MLPVLRVHLGLSQCAGAVPCARAESADKTLLLSQSRLNVAEAHDITEDAEWLRCHRMIGQ